MTTRSEALLRDFPVRKSRTQKESFRDWLCEALQEAGYAPRVEKEGRLIRSHNVVCGDPDTAEVVFTAHYDTCAVLPVPNFITPRNPVVYLLYQLVLTALMLLLAVGAEVLTLVLFDPPLWAALAVMYAVVIFLIWWMLAGKANRHNVNDNTSGVITLLEAALTLPEAQRNRAAFVFFDNEEKGLLGSAGFYRRHRAAMEKRLLLNFDCVSDGDYILFFPSRALKTDRAALSRLERAFPSGEHKRVEIPVTGFSVYPSDQKHFPMGAGIAALHRKKPVGYYLGRIHTGRDTVMDRENIELLRRGILTLLGAEEHSM